MNTIDSIDILMWIMIFLNFSLNLYLNNVAAALAWLVVACCMIRIRIYQTENFSLLKKVKRLR